MVSIADRFLARETIGAIASRVSSLVGTLVVCILTCHWLFSIVIFYRLLRCAGAGMETLDKWLTIDDLSCYLKMSRSKLYQLAQKGEFPAAKIGTQWRFYRDDIDHWLKSLRRVAVPRARASKVLSKVQEPACRA